VPPKFIYLLFWQHANFIGPSLKKRKLWKLPKTIGFILKYIVPPHWPTYIGERRTPFSKACGIKVRWYGEHVGENIVNLGNILGTHWELEGNIMQTHWKAMKNGKEVKFRSLNTCRCCGGCCKQCHKIRK
jgi:hypothetical protein